MAFASYYRLHRRQYDMQCDVPHHHVPWHNIVQRVLVVVNMPWTITPKRLRMRSVRGQFVRFSFVFTPPQAPSPQVVAAPARQRFPFYTNWQHMRHAYRLSKQFDICVSSCVVWCPYRMRLQHKMARLSSSWLPNSISFFKFSVFSRHSMCVYCACIHRCVWHIIFASKEKVVYSTLTLSLSLSVVFDSIRPISGCDVDAERHMAR